MTELEPEYPVLVTKRDGTYELRIWELRLVVRGRDLRKAYQELIERKKQITDWAREMGSLDELPPIRQLSGTAGRPPRLMAR